MVVKENSFMENISVKPDYPKSYHAIANYYDPEYDDKVKIEDIALNKDRIELYVGENERLVASVIPEDSTNYELEWTSDNPQVANVYSGIVVASSEGRATITVSIKDQDKKGTCEVVVVPVPTPVPTIEPTPIPTPTPTLLQKRLYITASLLQTFQTVL